MNEELWCSLEFLGFPGYDVSDEGRVRSYRIATPPAGQIADSPQRILSTGNASGYPGVILYDKKGTRHFKTVHTLVAAAFINLRQNSLFVLHRDGNPCNNNVENLYYGTQKDNSADTVRHGMWAHGESHGCAKLTKDDIVKIREVYAQGILKQTQIAELFGIGQTQVSHIVTGKQWATAGGPIIKRMMVRDEKGRIAWEK